MPLKAKTIIPESITVSEFYEAGKDQLKLRLVSAPKGLTNKIFDKSLNRPSLAITGYFKSFANQRIQVLGAGEMDYLKDMQPERRYAILEKIAQKSIPCMILTRDLLPLDSLMRVSEEFDIPLFISNLFSRDFLNNATLILEELFAPHTMEHGTLMDVKGVGTLIRGQSGVGKSECALELLERGHSLVADDVVHIKLMGEKELVGTSSDLNRGYMECRGIGIVSIPELFGIRAVRKRKSINLVVTFTEWSHGMDIERTGLSQQYYEILGKQISHVKLPVRPGRNLARLVEVASMVHTLKMMGHNTALEFNDRLISHMTNGKD